MPDRWQTYGIEFRGGLISNLSPLQHGVAAPGSARVMNNYEPSTQGGYRRIEGFTKYNTNEVTGEGNVLGVVLYNDTAVVARGQSAGNPRLYSASKGSGSWTDLSAEVATAVVNGAVSSNTNVAVDGNSGTIEVGDTVTGTGISGTVLVSTVTDQNNIVLDTAVSLSDDVALTFTKPVLTAGANAEKVRFAKYNFDGTDKLFIVDGVGYPFVLSGTAASGLTQLSTPTDIQGAGFVVAFKNHIFVANGQNVVYSAPYSDSDFTDGSGGGIINIGATVTDLIVFREQLIIFAEDRILRLVGSSQLDFQLQPIADDIGCVEPDTAQEISGDIIFLGPDGLRTVAATERNQDFELASVSKPIQKQIVQLTSQNSSFASVVIREKSQYRIFGFRGSVAAGTSKGIIGTQLQSEQGVGLNWAETTGIKAFVADSTYTGTTETILFANNDGYVYLMESGNNFDGDSITSTFSTPYFPISDARLRKTIYKATIYTETQGTLDLSLNLKYDLSEEGVIEPDTLQLENTSDVSGVFIFGEPNVQFADGAKINNGGGYSTGASSMVVDLMSLDSTSSPTLASGDTFQIITSSASSANFKKTYTLSSTPTITGDATVSPSTATTTLAFTPTLAADVSDNDSIIFTSVGGVDNTSVFSGESLKSIFDSQTLGSGFTVSLQFSSTDTNPPYSLDSAVLEYGQYGRR